MNKFLKISLTLIMVFTLLIDIIRWECCASYSVPKDVDTIKELLPYVNMVVETKRHFKNLQIEDIDYDIVDKSYVFYYTAKDSGIRKIYQVTFDPVKHEVYGLNERRTVLDVRFRYLNPKEWTIDFEEAAEIAINEFKKTHPNSICDVGGIWANHWGDKESICVNIYRLKNATGKGYDLSQAFDVDPYTKEIQKTYPANYLNSK